VANDCGMCHSCGEGIGVCVKAAEQAGHLDSTQDSHWGLVRKMVVAAPMTVSSSHHREYGITVTPSSDAATAAAVEDKRKIGQEGEVAPL